MKIPTILVVLWLTWREMTCQERHIILDLPNTSYFQVKGPIHNLTYLFLVNINEMCCPSPGQGNTQVLARDLITAATFLHGVRKIEAYTHGISQ